MDKLLNIRNKYTLSEFIKTFYSLLMTKFTFPMARLIRRPIYIRGKKHMSGCEGLTTGRFCGFDLSGTGNTLIIGKNCEFGDFTHIVAYGKVEIGNNVLMASKCFISDVNHGDYSGFEQSNPNWHPNERRLIIKTTRIGNNVWIGENTVILAGTQIGDGVVVGANSVISNKVPSNVIVAGAPAKIIKKYNMVTRKWERVNVDSK